MFREWVKRRSDKAYLIWDYSSLNQVEEILTHLCVQTKKSKKKKSVMSFSHKWSRSCYCCSHGNSCKEYRCEKRFDITVVLVKICCLKLFIKKLWRSSCIHAELIQCLLWVDDVEPHRTFMAGCLMSRAVMLSTVGSSYMVHGPAPVTSQSSVSVPSSWNERKCPHAFARYCAFVIMG